MAIRIDRVYTRGGDQGLTSLAGGQRVPKDSLRIESYGTVDELNAILGIVRVTHHESRTLMSPEDFRLADGLVEHIQNELFNLGSDLATLPANRHPRQPIIEARHVEALEKWIDRLNSSLPDLSSFVLPGGGRTSAFVHQARTVCRRAERVVTALSREEEVGENVLVYLNRLSDLLFVFGRWVARSTGEPEILWDPSKT